jgi:branched-chain amino acid transport system ATP-binding protein
MADAGDEGQIVVLNEGAVLAEGSPDQVRGDPLVAAAYLGSQAQ